MGSSTSVNRARCSTAFILKESDANLTDKVVIVTGANTGIGLETARALASAGATVIMGCRDVAKGKLAAANIRASVGAAADVRAWRLDLASLYSVRRFATKFLEKKWRLDILVNNAGVMLPGAGHTHVADAAAGPKPGEGWGFTMAANHLGHFALTVLLLPRLLRYAPSRVIVLSSQTHSIPGTLLLP